jgi:hypothetical protein
MVKSHLNFLIQIGDNNQGYVGTNLLQWANFVMPSVKFKMSTNRRFNRYELLDFCNDKNNDSITVLIAILAWGGMNRKHGQLLLKNPKPVLRIVENLRSNYYSSRKKVFDVFKEERDNGNLPGLGIGYFTKLICFLDTNLNGYIMDQWVSKSINLLTGQHIVYLTNGWVNDKNTSTNYENFCLKIDELANILNCSGFEAEKRIFSIGRGKGAWRNYLKKHY